MDSVVEQDFLSGIEPLPNSATSTPHASKLQEYSGGDLVAMDSFNSTDDPNSLPPSKPGFSPSPLKRTSSFSSPVITADSASFTNAANEITKKLQESLASSLKREREVEAMLSPGLKRNPSPEKSPSGLLRSNSQSSSPCKSPSKYRVRFDDEGQRTGVEISSPCDYHTPTKSGDIPPFPSSPAKRSLHNFMQDKAIDERASLLDSELSFLLSTKLPQNDLEKQKLFEFMKKMETSSSGDALSSLNFLGASVSADARMQPLIPRVDGNAANKSPIKGEKKGERMYKLGRKKPDLKKDAPKNTVKQKRSTKPNLVGIGKSVPVKKLQNLKNPSKAQHGRQVAAKRENVKDEPPVVQFTSEGQETISSMEAVRNHLQGMLKMNSAEVKPYNSEDLNLALGNKMVKKDEEGQESFRSTDTATLLSTHPSEFMPPPSSPDSSTSDVSALINSATSSIFSLLRSNAPQKQSVTGTSVSSSLTTENHILRDTLEKERFRRNHCEKQIQKLQNKVLEIQQELAVGQSVTRKKDMMIEQLDKTLSKVVGGWKVHEKNLTKSIKELTAEKEKYRTEADKHRNMIGGLQCDLNKVLDDLSGTQEKLQLKEEEQKMLQQTFQLKTHEISKVIDQKNSSIERLLNDKQVMVEEINSLTKRMEEQQEAMEVEKDRLLEDMKEQETNLISQLKQEKLKMENEKSRNTDLQKMLTSTQQEVTRLENLMGSLQQTLENMKMQSSVEEAKYSATLRKLDAEHQIELEKKVTEKLTELHEEAEEKERELRENHHKQIMEITSSHQAELEAQCRRYEDRIEQLEKRARNDVEEKERKLNEILKEKTENMRRQMVNKMQNLLQAHYNETLELVGSTTGTTPMRSSRPDASALLSDMRNSTRLLDSRLNDTMRYGTSLLADSIRHDGIASAPKSNPYLERPEVDVAMDKALIEGSSKAGNEVWAYPVNSTSVALSRHTRSAFSGPLTTYSTISAAPAHPANTSFHNDSISTTLTESRALERAPFLDSSTLTTRPDGGVSDAEILRFPVVETAFATEINLPMMEPTAAQSVQSTPICSVPETLSSVQTQDGIQELERQQHLQHYIKMLLDKSPGEPLQLPTPTKVQPQLPPPVTSLSPVVIPTPAHDENKENKSMEIEQPNHVTSEVAMSVINFLNQQLKASAVQQSPDVIPVHRTKLSTTSLTHSPKHQQMHQQQRMPQKFSKPNPCLQTKVGVKFLGKPPFGQHSPKKQDGKQLSLKDLDVNRPVPTISQSQFSEVSRMLGSYMNGDTQQAAEKLLSYLSESQNKDDQGNDLNASRSSLKRVKPRTPSKNQLPAWR